MRTYNNFTEEISARRLAELKAKGKGAAAAQKMASDRTTPASGAPKLSTSAPKSSAPTTRPQRALPPASGGALAVRPANKGAALVRSKQKPQTKTKPKKNSMMGKVGNKPGSSRGSVQKPVPDKTYPANKVDKDKKKKDKVCPKGTKLDRKTGKCVEKNKILKNIAKQFRPDGLEDAAVGQEGGNLSGGSKNINRAKVG